VLKARPKQGLSAPLDPQPEAEVGKYKGRTVSERFEKHAGYVKTNKMKLLCNKLPAFFEFGTTLGLLLLIIPVPVAHTHPIWHDFNSRSSVDSFITGSTILLVGGVKFGVPYYLTTTTPLPSGTNHYSLLC
jgi:hypothetical protein